MSRSRQDLGPEPDDRRAAVVHPGGAAGRQHVTCGALADRHRAAVGLLLPGVPVAGARLARGGSHDVVLLPGVAAVRIARTAVASEALGRRTALLERLGTIELPFAVPRPLSPVRQVAGRAAVAVSWVEGSPAPAGQGDPAQLRGVLAALAAVDPDGFDGLLDRPHGYAGHERWAELMLGEAVGRLPRRMQHEGRRRVEAALALEPVVPRLVHGDLAGHNMHWSAAGRLTGVLDWDLAQAFDPAVDIACLAGWHGWDVLRRTVDAAAYGRARVWAATFALEQIVRGVLDRATGAQTAERVARVVRWMESDGLGR